MSAWRASVSAFLKSISAWRTWISVHLKTTPISKHWSNLDQKQMSKFIRKFIFLSSGYMNHLVVRDFQDHSTLPSLCRVCSDQCCLGNGNEYSFWPSTGFAAVMYYLFMFLLCYSPYNRAAAPLPFCVQYWHWLNGIYSMSWSIFGIISVGAAFLAFVQLFDTLEWNHAFCLPYFHERTGNVSCSQVAAVAWLTSVLNVPRLEVSTFVGQSQFKAHSSALPSNIDGSSFKWLQNWG